MEDYSVYEEMQRQSEALHRLLGVSKAKMKMKETTWDIHIKRTKRVVEVSEA